LHPQNYVSPSGVAFSYDEAGHRRGEYDASCAIDETVYFLDTPIAVIKRGSGFQIYADHLNAPPVITDRASARVADWEGAPFRDASAHPDPSATGSSLAYNLRFPGQYIDSETGLHYNSARDFSPSLGRYIESDPIGLDGGTNTSQYVSA